MAGETALLVGEYEQAVHWLRMATRGNPSVGRIHAMLAAALQLQGRPSEAAESAATARRLSPDYTPEVMKRRGGKNTHPRYADARDRYVEAFRSAYGPP
jgi:predicted Zn-dependent protease